MIGVRYVQKPAIRTSSDTLNLIRARRRIFIAALTITFDWRNLVTQLVKKDKLLLSLSLLLLMTLPAAAQGTNSLAQRGDLMKVAQQQLNAGQNDLAIQALTELLRRGGNNLAARRLMIVALDRKGDFAASGTHLTSLFKLTKPTYFEWYYLGRVYASQNKNDQAANCLKQALDQNPKMEEAKLEMIKVLLSQNKIDEASEMCSEGYHGTTDQKLLDKYSDLYAQISDARAGRKPTVAGASTPARTPGGATPAPMAVPPSEAAPVAPFSQPGAPAAKPTFAAPTAPNTQEKPAG